MFKKIIQAIVGRLGYRIVPSNRDAASLMGFLERRPIKTVIDVGASDGKTVEAWMARYPVATIYGIEPLPQSFRLLKNLAEKSGGRVKALNYAVGEKSGMVNMHFHQDHPTSSSLLNSTSGGLEALPVMAAETVIEVEQTTLDRIFGVEPELVGPILLKMDVQGFEGNVLRGATNLLSSVTYVLTEITVADCYENQCEFDELHNILTAAGFKLMGFSEQFHLEDGAPVYADVVYVNKRDVAEQMNG